MDSHVSFSMQAVIFFGLALAVVLASGPATADPPKHFAAAHEQKKIQKKARSSAEKPFGREGDPRKVKRVIKVDMSDTMRFFPSEIRVKRGDTVRFVLRNGGQVAHEMVLGTMDDLKKHAELMRKNVDMDHDEPHAAHVEPGSDARMVWQFTKAGEFYYACLVPGHFDAGMIGTIVVR
jgi:uncharacterized cupredoxin-like copper-binding protein